MYPYMNYQRQEVTKVNGMAGAQAYQMPPNSSALLIDMNNPIVYLCVSDGAGLKNVTAYTITEYKPEDTSEYKALSDRIAKLEARINESHDEPDTKRKYEFNELIDATEKWKC